MILVCLETIILFENELIMEKTVSYYLHYLSRYISKKLERYDKENGISTHDCMVVDYICHRENENLDTIQKDIEDEFYIGKAVASDLISSLEKKGYIERRVDPSDQRKKILTVTKKGHDFNDFNLEKVKKFDNQLTDKLKKKDRDTLFRLFEDLILKSREEENDEKY